MKEQEQRLAIAEACPDLPKSMAGYIWSNSGYLVHPFERRIIDPLGDLNAMHAAICNSKLHTNNQLAFQYMENICEVIGIPEDRLCMALIHATAAQRAEAFLKTLNLWK